MGKPAARMGDPTAHGGVIMGGCPTVLIGGMPAARLTDMHVCPMVTPAVPPIPHVGGPITGPGVPTVLIGGMPAACVGDMAVCVGPPATILMGCPTVLIGPGGGGGGGGGAGSSGAASAMASAKQAKSGTVESTAKEPHWVEFEFVDKAGNPVSGLPYKLTDTENKDSHSKIRTDGKISRDSLKEGEAKVILRSLFNANWEKDKAKIGDKIKLSIESEGVDDGEKIYFTIWKRDLNAPDMVIDNLEAQINGNKADVDWEYGPADKDSKNGKNDKAPDKFKYSSPEFYFNAFVAPDLTARSGILYFEDFIEIELVDDEGNPIKNEDYILYLPNGEIREGKLDGNGYKKEEKLPGGIYNVRFPKLTKFKEE